jgi:V/A-type H+-transporting ATPase subunit E
MDGSPLIIKYKKTINDIPHPPCLTFLTLLSIQTLYFHNVNLNAPIMSEKLRILTEKIYREGVDKAKEESERIIEKAKADAKRIVSEALQEKERMIADTEARMETYQKKVTAEIKLAAQKAANQIKLNLHQLLQEKTVHQPVQKGLADPGILTEVLVACMQSLQKSGNESWSITLPKDQYKSVRKALESGEHELLMKGVTLEYSNGISYGFEIRPKGANYQLNFDDQAFAEFLGQFLKVETQELLKSDKA